MKHWEDVIEISGKNLFEKACYFLEHDLAICFSDHHNVRVKLLKKYGEKLRVDTMDNDIYSDCYFLAE